MKEVCYFLLILLIKWSDQRHSSMKKDGHRGQKKQFVNFGHYADSNAQPRSFEFGFGGDGGLSNGGLVEGAGYDEGFQNLPGMRSMQLNENSLGDVNLQGNNMDSYGGLFGGATNSYASLGGGGTDSINDLLDSGSKGLGNSALSQFAGVPSDAATGYEGQDGQSMSEFGFGQPATMSRGEAFFTNLNGGNEQDDLLSQYGNNGMEGGGLENNINLGDSINTGQGLSQFDMNNFEGLNEPVSQGPKGTANVALAPIGNKHKGNVHKQGDDRHGIGAGTMQDLLTSELGQLDSSDEKLQKMLESGLNTDGFSSSSNSNNDNQMTASPDNGLNSLLNPQNQMDNLDAQPSQSADELPNIFGSQQQQQSQQTINPLNAPMNPSSMGGITPVTVHAHASDKPGSDPKDAPPPEESRQTALQVQETASKQHKLKLLKLKKRLKLLREKLSQLEEEQTKKSSSNKNNDPKAARNDAIKKLLIKNLKLAAMIASKEIQLEEAKGRGLAYLSGKKEDDVDLLDDSSNDKSENGMGKAKPLTELSKKAEEEVNHLSRNPDLDKPLTPVKSNASISKGVKAEKNNQINQINTSQSGDNYSESGQTQKKNEYTSNKTLEKNSSFLKRINETLQVLDKTSPEMRSRSTLTMTSKRFLKRLQKQISSMLPPQAQVVEEKALATLYKSIKTKNKSEAKRKRKSGKSKKLKRHSKKKRRKAL